MNSNARINSKGQIIEELDIHLEKSEVDFEKSEVDLEKSEVDFEKSEVDLEKSEVDFEKSEVDLEKSEDPVSEKPLSLQKFIYNHDKNKIDEMEILAWCEIYLAAKKKGVSLFHSSGK